jgi:threonine/homoserine/homoserine lactone efflux protein
LVSGLGVASADAIYALIAGFGVTWLAAFFTDYSGWLRGIGSLVFCYLGARIFFARAAQEPAPVDGKGWLGVYGSIFFLTLTNPLTIGSFVTSFTALGLGFGENDYMAAVAMVAGVFCGSLLWWFVLSSGVGVLRDRITGRILQWVNCIAGSCIFLVGLGLLILGAGR